MQGQIFFSILVEHRKWLFLGKPTLKSDLKIDAKKCLFQGVLNFFAKMQIQQLQP